MKLATTFVVNGIRGEFAALRGTMVLGDWELDLSKAVANLQIREVKNCYFVETRAWVLSYHFDASATTEVAWIYHMVD